MLASTVDDDSYSGLLRDKILTCHMSTDLDEPRERRAVEQRDRRERHGSAHGGRGAISRGRRGRGRGSRGDRRGREAADARPAAEVRNAPARGTASIGRSSVVGGGGGTDGRSCAGRMIDDDGGMLRCSSSLHRASTNVEGAARNDTIRCNATRSRVCARARTRVCVRALVHTRAPRAHARDRDRARAHATHRPATRWGFASMKRATSSPPGG